MKTLSAVFAALFAVALASAGDYQIIRAYSPSTGGGTNIAKMYVGQDVSGAEVIEVFSWNLAAGTTTVSRVMFGGAITNTIATLTNSSSTAVATPHTIAKMWKDEDYILFSCGATNAFSCGTIMRGHKISQ